MARTQHTESLCFFDLQTGRKAEEGPDDSAVCSVLGAAGGAYGWKVRDSWKFGGPSMSHPHIHYTHHLYTNHRIMSNCVHEPREELVVVQGHPKSDKVRVRTSYSLLASFPTGKEIKILHPCGGLEASP